MRIRKPRTESDGIICMFVGSSYLSCLVLCHLVLGVLSALLALAVGASGFWDVDLSRKSLASCLVFC